MLISTTLTNDMVMAIVVVVVVMVMMVVMVTAIVVVVVMMMVVGMVVVVVCGGDEVLVCGCCGDGDGPLNYPHDVLSTPMTSSAPPCYPGVRFGHGNCMKRASEMSWVKQIFQLGIR